MARWERNLNLNGVRSQVAQGSGDYKYEAMAINDKKWKQRIYIGKTERGHELHF